MNSVDLDGSEDSEEAQVKRELQEDEVAAEALPDTLSEEEKEN
jgi:hypothetical protein